MRFFSVFFFLFHTAFLNAQQIDYNITGAHVLDGYDVVSYFEDSPQKGKPEFAATHDDVTFLFVSEAHLNAFKENCEKYIPQYGGYCAYAVAKKKKMQADPETYEIRDEKLYVFYNSWGTNTLIKWQKGNTPKLQTKADANWKKLQYKE